MCELNSWAHIWDVPSFVLKIRCDKVVSEQARPLAEKERGGFGRSGPKGRRVDFLFFFFFFLSFQTIFKWVLNFCFEF